MAYYLPVSDTHGGDDRTGIMVHTGVLRDMADLKVFWGPEICRLEYLVHLLDTGRIKDEYWPRAMGASS